jgi:hypothetical protein
MFVTRWTKGIKNTSPPPSVYLGDRVLLLFFFFRIGELLRQQARRRQLGLSSQRHGNGHTKKKATNSSSAARTTTLSGKKPTLPTMVPEDDSTPATAPFLHQQEPFGSPYYAPSSTYDGYFDDNDRTNLISNPQQMAHTSPPPSIFQNRYSPSSSLHQQFNGRHPYYSVASKHVDHDY